jgi:hypothetical protein
MEQSEQQQSALTVNESPFSLQVFEHAQRIAKMLSASDLIPTAYRGRVENVMIAMEMAHRSGDSPLMVMQNLNVIKGRPSWGSAYIIAKINASKRFAEDLDFIPSGTGDDYGYEAVTIGKDGKEKKGPKVTWKMVKDEGWLSKDGSKWKTMPELMFRYRAAAFFGRIYCPELLMGMQTTEEVIDITHSDIPQEPEYTVEQLQALYDEKLAELTKSEMDDAKRIINNQEVKSYKKLFNLLNSKN